MTDFVDKPRPVTIPDGMTTIAEFSAWWETLTEEEQDRLNNAVFAAIEKMERTGQ